MAIGINTPDQGLCILRELLAVVILASQGRHPKEVDMTPPMLVDATPQPLERCVKFADHDRAMEIANRQMSRWSNLLDRLAAE